MGQETEADKDEDLGLFGPAGPGVYPGTLRAIPAPWPGRGWLCRARAGQLPPGSRAGGLPAEGERAAVARMGGRAAEEDLAGGGGVAADVQGERDRGVGRAGDKPHPVDVSEVGEVERQGLVAGLCAVTTFQLHRGEMAKRPGVQGDRAGENDF